MRRVSRFPGCFANPLAQRAPHIGASPPLDRRDVAGTDGLLEISRSPQLSYMENLNYSRELLSWVIRISGSGKRVGWRGP
jgi:hypothetical protein